MEDTLPVERRLALVIANTSYDDEALGRLASPAQDATALTSVLEDPRCGFEVQTVLDGNSGDVAEAVEAFLGDAQRSDLQLLYFSCHGLKDARGRLYYATRNTRTDRLRSTAVSAVFVNDLLRDARARRKVLLLDCCYGGAFAKGMHVKAASAVHTADSFDAQGLVVLTATDETQYAFDGDVVRGSVTPSRFTATLVRGLSSGEADVDGDGLVTVDDAYEYVRLRLPDHGVPQSPRMWAFDVGGGPIVLARTRARGDFRLAPVTVPRQRRAAVPRADTAALDEHCKLTAQLFLNGEVVPILGDEVNLCGRPEGAAWEPGTSSFPPVEEELAAFLADRFGDDSDARDLPSVVDYVLEEVGEGRLYDTMRRLLLDVDYESSPLHGLLAAIPELNRRESLAPPLIVTINYDRALEQALEAAREPFDLLAYEVSDSRGRFVHYPFEGEPVVISRPNQYQDLSFQRSVVLKLRGGLDGTGLLVGTEDHHLEAAPGGLDRMLPLVVLERLLDSHALFLGLRMRHAGVGRLLNQILGPRRIWLRSWSILTDPDTVDIRFWRRSEVDVLNVDLADYAQSLARHLDVRPPRLAV